MSTAGQVSRPDSNTNRLSGTPSANMAATGAMVVSKPTAKKTTVFPCASAAIRTASRGEAMGRTSAPRVLACSRVRTSPFGALTGTRSMSPKATSVTSSWRAIRMAAKTSSSGQIHTGQPGPGINSIFSGKAPRRPAMVMARSWPPQTFMILNLPDSCNARILLSHCVDVKGTVVTRGRGNGDVPSNGWPHERKCRNAYGYVYARRRAILGRLLLVASKNYGLLVQEL